MILIYSQDRKRLTFLPIYSLTLLTHFITINQEKHFCKSKAILSSFKLLTQYFPKQFVHIYHSQLFINLTPIKCKSSLRKGIYLSLKGLAQCLDEQVHIIVCRRLVYAQPPQNIIANLTHLHNSGCKNLSLLGSIF